MTKYRINVNSNVGLFSNLIVSCLTYVFDIHVLMINLCEKIELSKYFTDLIKKVINVLYQTVESHRLQNDILQNNNGAYPHISQDSTYISAFHLLQRINRILRI